MHAWTVRLMCPPFFQSCERGEGIVRHDNKLGGNNGPIYENNKEHSFLNKCHSCTLEVQFTHVDQHEKGGHVTHMRLPAVHRKGDTPCCLINMDDCIARQDYDSTQC